MKPLRSASPHPLFASTKTPSNVTDSSISKGVLMGQMFFFQDEYYGRGLLEGEIRIKRPLCAELLRFLCRLSLCQTFGAVSPAIKMEKSERRLSLLSIKKRESENNEKGEIEPLENIISHHVVEEEEEWCEKSQEDKQRLSVTDEFRETGLVSPEGQTQSD